MSWDAGRAWLGWWTVSAGLWLALVDTTALAELAAGGAAASAGATAAVLVRGQRLVLLRPRRRDLAAAWRPLARVPPDLWRLLRALVRRLRGRRVRGSFYGVPFAAGGPDGESAARRALAEAAGSLAPNTYVLGLDEERGLLLVHQLVRTSDRDRAADPLRLR